jgi:hypothetical protein
MPVRVEGHVDRIDFICTALPRPQGHRPRCGQRDVLIHPDACRTVPVFIACAAFQVTSYLVGVDPSRGELEALRTAYRTLILDQADIEELSSAVGTERRFEVAVAGDVIEHPSNPGRAPGRALHKIRRVTEPHGARVLASPNAFGTLNYVRFLFGRYREGVDHAQSSNKRTLASLARRHGFSPIGAWTALNRMPKTSLGRVVYRLAAPILKLFPELGGMLVLLAPRDVSLEAKMAVAS